MKKFASSPISLLFVLTVIAVATTHAAPVRARATLLSLYVRSDAVMIGRFDKRQDISIERVGDGFLKAATRMSFDITSVLKGDNAKFVNIDDEEFRYQIQKPNELAREAVFVDDILSRGDDAPRSGDTVILFLKKQGDGYDFVDDRDGVRTIEVNEEAIFASRISELNFIFDGGNAQPEKIADWLVRCTSDRATRWDGTHELMQGFRHLEWRAQKDPNGYERIDPSVAYEKGADAAAALTAAQKSALTQILVSSDFALSSDKSTTLDDGDRELIALVRKWDPAAAARYLLGQLKCRAFSPHENAGMMYKIAELIDDADSAKLARSYADLNGRGRVSPLDKNEYASGLVITAFIKSAEKGLDGLQSSIN
jgi:hypothetical protein